MATDTKATAKDDGGKARNVNGTVAAPDIDDPWGLMRATRLAFIRKARTHPELSPEYLRVAEVLGALPDPTRRFDDRGRSTEDTDKATHSFLEWLTKVLHRYHAASQSRHALAFLEAEDVALTCKAAMLARSAQEAAATVYLHLDNAPLLWGRPGKLMGDGPRRPPKLSLETVEAVLRDHYEDAAEARAPIGGGPRLCGRR